MARRTSTGPRGVWSLVARAQRMGLSEGMRGRGGGWLALGVGAWGLQRMRSLSARSTEILLSEPLAPGQEMTISHRTTTRAEYAREQKQAKKDHKALQKQADQAGRAAKKARRRRGRRGR